MHTQLVIVTVLVNGLRSVYGMMVLVPTMSKYPYRSSRKARATTLLGVMLALALMPTLPAQQSSPDDITAARKALAGKQFGPAKRMFAAIVREHPESVEARLGLADAELGLREVEAGELDYRRVVAAQPQMWIAHKNLVIVEAALGRWSEFDRERALLRAARDRNAPGISTGDSDVIDSFAVHGQRWIVREYYEPAGRSLVRYNFESFRSDGRVQEYISLESAEDAKQAVTGGQVLIGPEYRSYSSIKTFALNWYTGKAHGSIALYPNGEPAYEKVRPDVLRFLRWQK